MPENLCYIMTKVGNPVCISKVVDALLDFTFDHTTDIRKYFDTLLDEVEKYKYVLRLAIQITTSPLFGERMRIKAKDFRLWYEKYAGELIKILAVLMSRRKHLFIPL